MANLWSQSGARVINDDRLIIRKVDGVFRIFNTPMYYSDIKKQTVLKQIFLISQSPENWVRQLSGSIGGSRLMAFCIQHNYDPRLVKKMTATVNQLIGEVGISELGFKPDKAIVKLIKARYVGNQS